MPARSIRMTIDSRLENVPLVGLATNRICALAPLNEIGRYQIELCVVEAVTNAVVHAYGNRHGSEVEVFLDLDDDRIYIEVSDRGRALNRPLEPRLDFDPDDVENLPEGGMGLFILDHLMSECSYRQHDGRNTFELVRYFEDCRIGRGGEPHD